MVFFKEILSYPEVRTKFFKRHLWAEILSQLDVEKLYPTKDTYIDTNYEKTASDLVFATVNKDKFVYMLLEHQSTPDREIAMRFAKYEMRILENFRKEFPDRKYPTVFQVLIYNGKTKYNISTKFWDLFEDPQLRKKISDTGYKFIDLQAIQDTLKKYGILEFFGRELSARNRGLLEIMEKICETCDNDELRVDLISWVALLRYVAVKHHSREEFEHFLKKYKQEEVMGSFAQEYIEKGMQQGIQQGVQQGIRQEQQQIAKNMLSEKIDLRLISRVTGLSQEQIKQLQD